MYIKVNGELNSVRGVIVCYYYGGVEKILCCWISCGLMFFDCDGGDYECAWHGTPFIFWSKRMWWWFQLHAPVSLSKVQPRFAHISEEKNMARIFGNCHLLLIIIFYPFPGLFSLHFLLKSTMHAYSCSYISQSRKSAILCPINTIYMHAT